jgi:lantibiotic biosynthesis protein
MRLQALALTGPGDAVPAEVRQAWRARADAAGAYAELLAGTGRDPAGVLETLLHLHHNRVHGPGRATEFLTYRLARACALHPAAANGQTPPPCTPPR